MELEADYRRECGSGTKTLAAFSVEARHNFHEPVTVGGQIFDNRWRMVIFENSTSDGFGVPVCDSFEKEISEYGFLKYASAQALRWWFHANAGFGTCLETRIVEHKITITHKIEAIAAHCHVHGGDRSNIMPDWGKK